MLGGRDLAGLGDLPTLVFFNACEAGRVRGQGRNRGPTIAVRVARNVGLAESFLQGGVANYLGTYWPVGDEAAEVFADVFYKGVVRGTALGEAVQNGRRAVRETGSKDWAATTTWTERPATTRSSVATVMTSSAAVSATTSCAATPVSTR